MASAADIIAGLELRPHPEGGHYRETFRDTSADADGRARSTAIYYLLSRGERSHWHRIDIVEVWHYYAGNALTLRIAHDGGVQHTVRLAPDVAAGDRPPATGRWSDARWRPDSSLLNWNWRRRGGSQPDPSFRDGPKDQASDAQLRIGESRDSGFDASHRPGMTAVRPAS